jgi:DNA-binding FadR family transcriptional regulator
VAAENRKDSDIDRIYAALAAMREHMQDKAANEAADRLFHLRIAESTGNSVLLQMVTALWDHTRGADLVADGSALSHARVAPRLAGRPPARVQRAARARPHRAPAPRCARTSNA